MSAEDPRRLLNDLTTMQDHLEKIEESLKAVLKLSDTYGSGKAGEVVDDAFFYGGAEHAESIAAGNKTGVAWRKLTDAAAVALKLTGTIDILTGKARAKVEEGMAKRSRMRGSRLKA